MADRARLGIHGLDWRWSWLMALGLVVACKPSSSKNKRVRAAGLARDAEREVEAGYKPPVAAYRDGVLVVDGDILVGEGEHHYGVVHYGKPWPGARVPFRFSRDPEFVGDEDSKNRVREAVQIARDRTGLNWVELKDKDHEPGGYVEIRFWDKRWGSAQVGYVGEKQVVNLPEMPSLRLTLHEFGHVMGLGHEHQHPSRDKYVEVNRDCVPKEHRDSFAPRTKHVVSREYDIDSIMHYRSAGFCRKDTADADGDGNTRECAFVDDDPAKGKCYALRRQWGACDRDNCEDRDGDGFREYIRGSDTLSDGDVLTIQNLHRRMLDPSWPSPSFGESMVVADTNGDGEVELYVAAMKDGRCGALWELRPNTSRSGLVHHAKSSARWRCAADAKARLVLKTTGTHVSGPGEVWVGVSGPSTGPRGGWVEQWHRNQDGELKIKRRLSAQEWGMPANTAFGYDFALADEDGDGRAERVAIGEPGQQRSGRVYYAQGLFRKAVSRSGRWAENMGQLAGRAGFGQSLGWVYEKNKAALVLGVGCTPLDGDDCQAELWRWSDRTELRRVVTQKDLNLRPAKAPAPMSFAPLPLRQGLWWVLPDGCTPRGGSFEGICGGAWPLEPWRQGLIQSTHALRPLSSLSLASGPRKYTPIVSSQGRAVIVQGPKGKAFVGISQFKEQQWIQIPPPRGMPAKAKRDLHGWWDSQGLYIVTAWTDLVGERHLDLDQLPLDTKAFSTNSR